jgi:ribosomal protein RSM22 (predicted rRNA methylase)
VAGALPADLASAIAAMLDGVSRNDLAGRARRISQEYRDRRGSAAAVAGREDVLAYLVTRMPATYAATHAAFAALRYAVPAFVPRSVTDVGAGPGTASFAAVEAWPDIGSVTMVDGSRAFLAAAEHFSRTAVHPALANARRIAADATRLDANGLPGADLTVAAYALAEIGEPERSRFVAALWQSARAALVLVEPGTPDGFERIRTARAQLIAAGAGIAAPCPHALPCPIVASDWCHFAERVQRARDHRIAKGGEAPFEDEKYAYVVAVRDTIAVAPYASRVLAPPRVSKAGIGLKLCTEAGTIAYETAAKRDRDAYAVARRAWWGDALRTKSGG